MRTNEPKVIEESIYGLMWKMDINDKVVVPIEKWNDVRVFAYQLKKKLERQFTVNRMRTGRTKMDFLLIQRTK